MVLRLRPAPMTAIGARGQHAANRVHRRDLLASLEAGPRLGRDRGRELDPDLARLALHRDAEAALAEDVEHLVVLGQHVGLEDGNPVFVRRLGEALEQQRPKAAALVRVRDREADLGPIVGGAVVARLADDVAAVDRQHAAVLAALDAGPAPGRGFDVLRWSGSGAAGLVGEAPRKARIAASSVGLAARMRTDEPSRRTTSMSRGE
jgi:hypothetical protein